MSDILLLVLSAVLCGADDWDEIALFGSQQESWLRRYGSFAHGIPSHDTINRVFSLIDPDEFSACFTRWANGKRKRPDMGKELIAIDGKRICGSYTGQDTQSAIHMVSALATSNNLCLGHIPTSRKSNEITAIPELLDLLDIEGDVVSIDAMGCQTKIAAKIIDSKADYILAVKGNQSTLESDIDHTVRNISPIDSSTQTDVGHGRIETRTSRVYKDFRFIETLQDWEKLTSIVKIDAERIVKSTGKTTRETRYYISSLDYSAEEFNHNIRGHWGIENKLHWVLDVTFREDDSRKRKGNAPKNFNTILKYVLALLAKDNTDKHSNKRKRMKAALSTEYREKLLDF